MTMTLVRHLKVKYRWRLSYNARGFERACAEYNEAPVVRPRTRLTPGGAVIASTMQRAIDTARLLFGREPDRTVGSMTEVPMKPFLATSIFFPRVVWKAFGRLQWLLGVKTQPESFADTARRVKAFTNELLAAGTDCLVVSHGWVLKVMIRRLNALGFRGPQPAYLKNGVPFVYRR